jgi:hypothetical protein
MCQIPLTEMLIYDIHKIERCRCALVFWRASIDFPYHSIRAVAVGLSAIGGISDPIWGDFDKSETTALEKCLS